VHVTQLAQPSRLNEAAEPSRLFLAGADNTGVGGVEEPTVEADEDDREGDDTPPLHNFLRRRLMSAE
jgi:hypothetical protein